MYCTVYNPDLICLKLVEKEPERTGELGGGGLIQVRERVSNSRESGDYSDPAHSPSPSYPAASLPLCVCLCVCVFWLQGALESAVKQGERIYARLCLSKCVHL